MKRLLSLYSGERVSPGAGMIRGAVLAVFFLLGSFGGYLYGANSFGDYGESLRSYFSNLTLSGVAADTYDLRFSLLHYFGYPFVLFLLGFSSVGAFLIPALAALFGFLTMFSISALTFVFGHQGVLLAIGMMLVRLLFSLPCFFLMADKAWPLSVELALLSFGRGKRAGPVLYRSSYFFVFLLCVVVLAAGVCAERLLTPFLFRLALEEVMI